MLGILVVLIEYPSWAINRWHTQGKARPTGREGLVNVLRPYSRLLLTFTVMVWHKRDVFKDGVRMFDE